MNLFTDLESKMQITSGFLKNSKIFFKANLNLRPTLAHNRETLFNWLNSLAINLADQEILDAFAGSGILSFEAISRGAKIITINDINRQNILTIKNNVQRLNLEKYFLQIHYDNQDFLHYKHSLKHNNKYDLVFLDPPYQMLADITMLKILLDKQLIKVNSLIYLETDFKYSNPKIQKLKLALQQSRNMQKKHSRQKSMPLIELLSYSANKTEAHNIANKFQLIKTKQTGRSRMLLLSFKSN